MKVAGDRPDPFEVAVALAARGDVDALLEAWSTRDAGAADDQESARWALLLGEAGLLDAARTETGRIGDARLRGELDALLADADPAEAPGDTALDADDLVTSRDDGPSPDAVVVETFLRFFAGRRDLYAQQWFDERRKRSGYRPVHEPLTERVVREHLAGRRTIGQYLLDADARCSFGLLDLDVSSDVMAVLRAKAGDDASALDHTPLREHALALMRTAASVGLRLYPEDSGSKGLHLWMFFHPARPARAVRGVLSQIVASAPTAPPTVAVEVYPRQDLAGPRGLSSLVKLPLGVHQVTLRRCPLLDDRLSPLPDGDALAALRPAPPDALDALLGRRVVPLPAPELAPTAPLPPLSEVRTPRSLAEALRAVEPGAADAACEAVLTRCGVLRWVADKAHAERRLAPDELRALIYTIGLIGARNTVVERALAAAGASFQILERARRGLPNPAGCSRLRTLPGAPTCDACPASASARPYPTPVLFAVGEVEGAPPRHAPFAPWLDADADVVASPFETIGDSLRRIEARLERLEDTRRPVDARHADLGEAGSDGRESIP